MHQKLQVFQKIVLPELEAALDPGLVEFYPDKHFVRIFEIRPNGRKKPLNDYYPIGEVILIHKEGRWLRKGCLAWLLDEFLPGQKEDILKKIMNQNEAKN